MIEKKLFYASLIAFIISLLFLLIFSLALSKLDSSKYASNCSNSDTTNSLGKLYSTLLNSILFMTAPIIVVSLIYIIYYLFKGRYAVAKEEKGEGTEEEKRSWKKVSLYIFLTIFIISLISTILFSMALSELDSSEYKTVCNSTALPYLESLHTILLIPMVVSVLLLTSSIIYILYYFISNRKTDGSGSSSGETSEQK